LPLLAFPFKVSPEDAGLSVKVAAVEWSAVPLGFFRYWPSKRSGADKVIDFRVVLVYGIDIGMDIDIDMIMVMLWL
jgi:hypothetical protein